MRSKSEIKTTKHIACEQKNRSNAYVNIDIKIFLAFFLNGVLSQNQRLNEFDELRLIEAEFNELTLTEIIHDCVKEVVVNEANVLD